VTAPTEREVRRRFREAVTAWSCILTKVHD
jgi:hypothetical protein